MPLAPTGWAVRRVASTGVVDSLTGEVERITLGGAVSLGSTLGGAVSLGLAGVLSSPFREMTGERVGVCTWDAGFCVF